MSWVASANVQHTDFPLQNLPYGRFWHPSNKHWSLGIAIGDEVLDLKGARSAGLEIDPMLDLPDLRAFMELGPSARRRCRHVLFEALREGSAMAERLRAHLLPQEALRMGLPCTIGDYTDFFTGIHHAREAGRLSRPESPLTPNYKWLPIAYHGRASSIFPSGTSIRRPWGQFVNEKCAVEFAPTRRLDYELEVGVLIGHGNETGRRIPIMEAGEHWFGLVLLNDWSARDIQRWENQPLGPFLSKNFASSISPWVVTQEALAPFRGPMLHRLPDDPSPMPHLWSDKDATAGGIEITLEAWIQSPRMPTPERITRCSFRDSSYWSIAQMITHHTSNGCNLNAGDLLGTGTQSGSDDLDGGCLLELTQGGRRTLFLTSGEARTFLEDGDKVDLRGYCEREGFKRIGFGSVSGSIAPALD